MAMTSDERRAIIGCVFASGCILFAPGEFRAGAFLFVAATVLAARHLVLTRRELKNNPAPPAGAKAALAPPAVAPSSPGVADPTSKPG